MVIATPRPLYPREKDPVPTVQEAGWACLNRCEKSRPLQEYDPLTVQSVASRYTDYVIPAQIKFYQFGDKKFLSARYPFT